MANGTTLYSEDTAAEICHRLSIGETLRQICRSPGMPAASTVCLWVTDDREGFAERYARARELGIEAIAEEIIEISDDGSNDWMTREGKDGEGTSYAVNGEHVSRSKLRADSRRWLLSKLRPEKYGDRLELAGNVELKMSDDQLESRVAQLLGKAAAAKASGGAGETQEEA